MDFRVTCSTSFYNRPFDFSSLYGDDLRASHGALLKLFLFISCQEANKNIDGIALPQREMIRISGAVEVGF